MISERVLQARMAEVGRIKIGGLEEKIRKTAAGDDWQAPTKFEHFVVTTQERDAKGNFLKDEVIHSIIGPQPKELKVRLLYNDIDLNFRTELALYNGKTCLCRGNGEVASRLDQKTGELTEVACPCPKLDQEKYGCKPHGVLNCLLDQAQICGGTYKFATTSWNSIRGMVSSLKFIATCTGGKIAGLPLVMKYTKKTTTTKAGKPTTIPVIIIVYEGNPVQMLENAIQNETQRIKAGIYLETLEVQVRREMKNAEVVDGILDADEIPEFHPTEETEDGQPATKTIGQAISESESAPISGAAETEAKTTKAASKVTRQAPVSPNPSATPAAAGAKPAKPAEPKQTTTASTEAEAKEAAYQPSRGFMMQEITKLRALKKIQTPDWQSIVNNSGIKDLNAASWSDAEMFKVLQTLKAKE